MSKRITYLFGAGASYHACPIWKEQGGKMIDLAKYVLPDATFSEAEENNYINDKDKIFWNMGYHGKKAIEFNTIDTFAKKLYLNDSWHKLTDLKTSVSMFFTIWQLTGDKNLKNFDKATERFKTIDQRYISLLATCLEKDSDKHIPKLNQNIRFVTWNYDLQIEGAYELFCDNIKWGDIDQRLSYVPDEKDHNKNLCVCHLNGFHGFYDTETNYFNYMFKTEHLSLDEIIKEIDFIFKNLNHDLISFARYINYAWEKDSPLSNIAREQASKIFSETDILVIIGYSFPSFNREIDKDLFDGSKNHIQKIIYQDPNGSAEYLSEAFDIDKKKIETVTNNNEQFILPSLF
jgi:hypothetical protein